MSGGLKTENKNRQAEEIWKKSTSVRPVR